MNSMSAIIGDEDTALRRGGPRAELIAAKRKAAKDAALNLMEDLRVAGVPTILIEQLNALQELRTYGFVDAKLREN